MTPHFLSQDEKYGHLLSVVERHGRNVRLISCPECAEVFVVHRRIFPIGESLNVGSLTQRLRSAGFRFVDEEYLHQGLIHAKFRSPESIWVDSLRPWGAGAALEVEFSGEVLQDEEDLEQEDADGRLDEVEHRLAEAEVAFESCLKVPAFGEPTLLPHFLSKKEFISDWLPLSD